MKIETIDLDFLGNKEIIASYLLMGGGSAAIVETGPSTCLDTLKRGLSERNVSPGDVAQVLLTHIHLDHAGASGHLAEYLPNATFYVHEVGCPHLIDPSKLLESASRIYGDRMDELWGETLPVPEDRLVSLKGEGEEIEVAGGWVTAHDTPGHAYHHLAYFDPESRALFAGDAAGIRLPGKSYVRPPTPPPEVDMEAWMKTIQKMRSLNADSVMPTHFGRYDDAARHLNEIEQRLQDWLLFVQERMESGLKRDEIAAELKDRGDEEMLSAGAELEDTERYEIAGNYETLTSGIMRYVSKRMKETP